MKKDENRKQHKGGRIPKTNPRIHRYVFRLTDEENAKLLALYEASEMLNKAHFITSLLFSKEMKTVKLDKGTIDFYMRLTLFHSQFRAIGVNYNQVVKLLYHHFSEKKASFFLFKLEKQTKEMIIICQKIIELIEEFDSNYLKK